MDLMTLLPGALGGVVGGLGAVVQKWLDYKDRNASRAHELAMRDKDRELLVLELSHQSEIARVDADTQIAVKELDATAAAMAADRATYGESLTGRLVDFARGVIRPIITMASMALMGWATYRAFQDGPALSAATQEQIIQTALFTASGAIGFWFGMRSSGFGGARARG